MAGALGLEPRIREPKSFVLPITPYPNLSYHLNGGVEAAHLGHLPEYQVGLFVS